MTQNEMLWKGKIDFPNCSIVVDRVHVSSLYCTSVYTVYSKYNCACSRKSDLLYSVPCAYISDENAICAGTERGESKKRDNQTTDPTLSLLRQLWCAVDVDVVVASIRILTRSFLLSFFFFVTLMILNYCLMIYRIGYIWQK